MKRPAARTRREDGTESFRVHKIVAEDLPEAWRKVSAELGRDAVVLRTAEVHQGGFLGLRSRSVIEIQAVRWEDLPSDLKKKYARKGSGGPPALPLADLPAQAGAPASSGHGTARPPREARDGNGAPRPAQELGVVTRQIAEVHRQMGEVKELVAGVTRLVRAGAVANYPEELRGIYLSLLENQVADDLSRDLIEGLVREMTGSELRSQEVVRERLLAAVERRLLTAGGIRLSPGKARVVALVGPTGVGKTTTLAKLAAHFKYQEHAAVSLASIDTYRIGAAEQLQNYAQILDIPLRVCLTARDLGEAIASHRGEGLVMIDTPGCSPRDGIKMRELKSFLDAVKPDEIHLVLGTTAQADHLFTVLDAYASFGIDRVILTKLDECTRFGLILTVLARTQRSLSYITDGQCVPKDIQEGNPSRLARLVLGEAPL